MVHISLSVYPESYHKKLAKTSKKLYINITFTILFIFYRGAAVTTYSAALFLALLPCHLPPLPKLTRIILSL